MATPMSLLQHRRITYVDAEKRRAEVEVIDEEAAAPESTAPGQTKRYDSCLNFLWSDKRSAGKPRTRPSLGNSQR